MNNNPYNYENNMIDKTYQYSRKYNLHINPGTKGWNDEGDAFRHTFMEASMSLKMTPTLSKIGGNIHEIEGKFVGQDPKEENMDKWNNWQGRDIGEHIKQEIPPEQLKELIRTGKIDDIIAEKVYERMKAGKLIINPNDSRNYEKTYGKDSQYSKNKKSNISNYSLYGHAEKNNIQEKIKDYFKSHNKSINNVDPDISNKIYTIEEVGRMKPEEFLPNQDRILEDFTTGKMMREKEAQEKVQTGEIYVKSYTRSDGTKVSDYYRRR